MFLPCHLPKNIRYSNDFKIPQGYFYSKYHKIECLPLNERVNFFAVQDNNGSLTPEQRLGIFAIGSFISLGIF